MAVMNLKGVKYFAFLLYCIVLILYFTLLYFTLLSRDCSPKV